MSQLNRSNVSPTNLRNHTFYNPKKEDFFRASPTSNQKFRKFLIPDPLVKSKTVINSPKGHKTEDHGARSPQYLDDSQAFRDPSEFLNNESGNYSLEDNSLYLPKLGSRKSKPLLLKTLDTSRTGKQELEKPMNTTVPEKPSMNEIIDSVLGRESKAELSRVYKTAKEFKNLKLSPEGTDSKRMKAAINKLSDDKLNTSINFYQNVRTDMSYLLNSKVSKSPEQKLPELKEKFKRKFAKLLIDINDDTNLTPVKNSGFTTNISSSRLVDNNLKNSRFLACETSPKKRTLIFQALHKDIKSPKSLMSRTLTEARVSPIGEISGEVQNQVLCRSTLSKFENSEDPYMQVLKKELPNIFSSTPSNRKEVLILGNWLVNSIKGIQEDKGLISKEKFYKADEVYSVCFNELVRQVSFDCMERADLLMKVWKAYLCLSQDILEDVREKERNMNAKITIECEEIRNEWENIVKDKGKEIEKVKELLKEKDNEIKTLNQRIIRFNDDQAQNIKETKNATENLKKFQKFYEALKQEHMDLCFKHEKLKKNPGLGDGVTGSRPLGTNIMIPSLVSFEFENSSDNKKGFGFGNANYKPIEMVTKETDVADLLESNRVEAFTQTSLNLMDTRYNSLLKSKDVIENILRTEVAKARLIKEAEMMENMGEGWEEHVEDGELILLPKSSKGRGKRAYKLDDLGNIESYGEDDEKDVEGEEQPSSLRRKSSKKGKNSSKDSKVSSGFKINIQGEKRGSRRSSKLQTENDLKNSTSRRSSKNSQLDHQQILQDQVCTESSESEEDSFNAGEEPSSSARRASIKKGKRDSKASPRKSSKIPSGYTINVQGERRGSRRSSKLQTETDPKNSTTKRPNRNSQLDRQQISQNQEGMTIESSDSEEGSLNETNTVEGVSSSSQASGVNTSLHSKMKITIPRNSMTTDMHGKVSASKGLLGEISEEPEGVPSRKMSKRKKSRLEGITEDEGLLLTPSPIKGEIHQADSNIQTSSLGPEDQGNKVHSSDLLNISPQHQEKSDSHKVKFYEGNKSIMDPSDEVKSIEFVDNNAHISISPRGVESSREGDSTPMSTPMSGKHLDSSKTLGTQTDSEIDSIVINKRKSKQSKTVKIEKRSSLRVDSGNNNRRGSNINLVKVSQFASPKAKESTVSNQALNNSSSFMSRKSLRPDYNGNPLIRPVENNKARNSILQNAGSVLKMIQMSASSLKTPRRSLMVDSNADLLGKFDELNEGASQYFEEQEEKLIQFMNMFKIEKKKQEDLSLLNKELEKQIIQDGEVIQALQAFIEELSQNPDLDEEQKKNKFSQFAQFLTRRVENIKMLDNIKPKLDNIDSYSSVSPRGVGRDRYYGEHPSTFSRIANMPQYKGEFSADMVLTAGQKHFIMEKMNNPGQVTIARLRHDFLTGKTKFKIGLPLKTVLKQLTIFYYEKIHQGRENPMLKEQDMGVFVYKQFINTYGFTKFGVQKFAKFAVSIQRNIEIHRIHNFAKMMGLLEPENNYTVQESKQYLNGMEYIMYNIAGTFHPNSDIEKRHLIPFAKALEYVKAFMEKRRQNEQDGDSQEFMKDLERFKATNVLRNHDDDLIDIDLFLERMVLRYRQLINKAKDMLLIVFLSADFLKDNKVRYAGFMALYKAVETDKGEDRRLEETFISYCDVMEEDGIAAMSKEQFFSLIFDLNLFSEQKIWAYLGVSNDVEFERKFEDFKEKWADHKKTMLECLDKGKSSLPIEIIVKWKSMINIIEDDLNKEEIQEKKAAFIRKKILFSDITTNCANTGSSYVC